MDDMALVREYAAHQSEAAFAELVSRHLGLVYSAALRQLRAPHLAEEVAQTVFIILARKAGQLRAGTVLPAWLLTTTRYAALAQIRASLRRQQREQEAYMQSLLNEPDYWPEIAPLLDEAMAKLGETDRNAIVLRFFQNKTLAEVGASLGASEDAARVRVNRALDKLGRLFAKRGITVPAALLAGALSANSVQAAPAGLAVSITAGAKGALATVGFGIGSKILSVLGKTFVFSWLVPLLSLAGALPSLVLTFFIGRMERKNFRDPQGFRPQLHQQFFRSFFWGFPLLLLAFAIFNNSVAAAWGVGRQQLLLAGFMVFVTLISLRSLTISRGPYHISMFLYVLIMTGGAVSVAFGWLPKNFSQVIFLAANAFLLGVLMKRPTPRMDYSLFLRAAHGQLSVSDRPDQGPQAAGPFGRQSLLAFARFLGSRLLVNNFRWETGGLRLRLMPVGNRFLANMSLVFMPPINRGCSQLLLGWDGLVTAHCGKADTTDLAGLRTAQVTGPQPLEFLVSQAVTQAWQDFRTDNLAAAERAVGELPESDIFLVPPARAKSTRYWRSFLATMLLLLAAIIILELWRPPWVDGMKSVSVTDAQVQAFLGNIQTNPNPRVNHTQRSYPGDPLVALDTCIVLPPKSLLTSNSLEAVRQEVFRATAFGPQSERRRRLSAFENNWLLDKAMLCGWLDWNDVGLKPEELSAFLHSSEVHHWQFRLGRRRAWSWVKRQAFDAERLDIFTFNQLRWLGAVDCFDLLDRNKLIQQIASVQVLSGTPPGQPPLHDWKAVRGLFFTPCAPALQDTYFSLAALEILGGLDKIDREACIRGILSRHRGKGYFTSPDSGGFNEYHIDGSARDTIAAFESLRILGALDRVKDLDKWQFRVARHRTSRPDEKGVRTPTWDEVEAWVCQQRFKQILSEHQANPQKPYRSLLAPNA